MEAGKMVKMEGKQNDLLQRIANDNMFGLTMEELEAIMIPENFVGIAPEQTEDYIKNFIQPILEKNREILEEQGEEIRV